MLVETNRPRALYDDLCVETVQHLSPLTRLLRFFLPPYCFATAFRATSMHLPDPDVRAISLLSNSPNQNDLILVHFLQFHFRSTSGDCGTAIYDDIESMTEKQINLPQKDAAFLAEIPARCLLSLEKFNATTRKSHKYIGKYRPTRFEMHAVSHEQVQRDREAISQPIIKAFSVSESSEIV
ncbi:Uncharacterized protein DBV15_04762 [Temnothorax longispinosus]|uniref:Uncharacterized protein n=1 Tax=Temnothorax longispinosus TaxID=300112 RepID=A0A4S2L1N8_9HYME|nr:Uncharacterized protein DBV15_04762 [Temnothorax longispinosus]